MRPSRSLPTALQHPINTGQTRASNRIQPGRSAKHQQRPPNQANFNEFLEQLSHYRAYLKHEPHKSQIKRAYQNTAERLVELGGLADKIRARAGQSPLPLGHEIVAATRPNDIDVATEAALVVVGLPAEHKEAGAWDSWTKNHASKLEGKIPMLVVKTPGHLSFAKAQLVPAAQ